MPRSLSDFRPFVLGVATLGSMSCGGSGGGGTGTPPIVTPVSVTITPPAAPVVFGALGRTRQLAVVVVGSDGNPIVNPAVSWESTNSSVATVSASGLLTALANGTTSIAARIGSIQSTSLSVTVSQIAFTITVSSPSGLVDSLRTSTRTQLYRAVAGDSTGNTVASPMFAWTSSNTAVATVGAASGLVTAGTSSGTTSIQATSGALSGAFPFALALYPATVTVTPTTATLTTAGATRFFSGSVADSAGAPITITMRFWVSRSPAVASISNPNGPTTTASAVANGTTFIVFSASSISDSAQVIVSLLASGAPTAVAVTVGDNFFKSVRNNSVNAATDTVAVGGTVTWTWSGFNPHTVESLGPPAFTSSGTKTGSGTHAITFGVAGTYTYDCAIHGGAMTGTIIVR